MHVIIYLFFQYSYLNKMDQYNRNNNHFLVWLKTGFLCHRVEHSDQNYRIFIIDGIDYKISLHSDHYNTTRYA